MPSSNVRKGQQYCCTDRNSTVWQVLAVSSDPNGILHAQLCKVERPYELKTLCCSLLDNPRCYCLLSDDSDAGVGSDQGGGAFFFSPAALSCRRGQEH